MTNEEALIELTKFVELKTTQKPVFLSVITEAVNKRIPKKPFGKNRFSGMRCLCGKPVYMHMLYCNNCGQQLDWSQDEQS